MLVSGLVFATLTLTLTSAFAHDPKPILRSIYGAPIAVVTTYEVKAGSQTDFLDAMVQSGPYNRVLYAFANERIIEGPSDTVSGITTFISFARYYDISTANFVDSKRNPAIAQYLAKDPARVEAKLVEHDLADWGWEHNSQQAVFQVKPLGSEEIFEKNITALSFFKSGYVGQTGIFEILPEGTSTDSIREALQRRTGLSGASILTTSSGVAVYSEYFKTPPLTGTDQLTAMESGSTARQMGMVVQNYVSR